MFLGNYPANCPADDLCKELQCFTPCEHTDEVYKAVRELKGIIPASSQAFLRDLLQAFLQDHENLLKQACDPLPIDEQGARLGLPALQCAVSNYTLTPLNNECDSCQSLFVVTPNGPKSWFNFAETLPDVYAALVQLLRCSGNYVAGGFAISQFIAAFGGQLEGLASGVYTISLPNDPQILSIVPLIDSLMPFPAGLSAQYIIKDC